MKDRESPEPLPWKPLAAIAALAAALLACALLFGCAPAHSQERDLPHLIPLVHVAGCELPDQDHSSTSLCFLFRQQLRAASFEQSKDVRRLAYIDAGELAARAAANYRTRTRKTPPAEMRQLVEDFNRRASDF